MRIASHSSSDINDSETYAASSKGLPWQIEWETSVNSKLNLTEWWKITEDEKLSKPFDVGEKLVAGLQHVLLEMVSFLILI